MSRFLGSQTLVMRMFSWEMFSLTKEQGNVSSWVMYTINFKKVSGRIYLPDGWLVAQVLGNPTGLGSLVTSL